MHLLVTDRLSCARCGPEFGLIIAVHEMRERRVLEGTLSCSNCREGYPIAGGFADLRPVPRGATVDHGPSAPADADSAGRLAALLGVERGPGLLVLLGSSACHAHPLSLIVEGIEVAAIHPPLRVAREQEGVSRIAISDRLPFLTGSIRGLVLEGGMGVALLPEAARVLGRGSRLVVLGPPANVAPALEARGFHPLMQSDEALVSQLK